MPTGFQIGPLYIHFYGIILMFGALMGAWLATVEARRRGQDTEIVWDGLIWVLIGGILGSRIWHILTPPPSFVERGITTAFYLTHPLDAISIWKGGLGIPGAIIGGVLALYLFCRSKKISFLLWTDIAAPGLALGQAIGRWGNFVNQEVYGAPTNLPWAIRIDPQYRLPAYLATEYYHPLFLYESLLSFANMGILLWLARRYDKRLYQGDIFLIYLVNYTVVRFFLEFLRLDAAQVGGLNVNQTVSLLVGLAAGGILAWRHLRHTSAGNTELASSAKSSHQASPAPQAIEDEALLSDKANTPAEIAVEDLASDEEFTDRPASDELSPPPSTSDPA
jgi:phosphatidylglycerol:prolipoprotein diacylglycerol transferase